jgi:FAD dependent oxidoreductase
LKVQRCAQNLEETPPPQNLTNPETAVVADRLSTLEYICPERLSTTNIYINDVGRTGLAAVLQILSRPLIVASRYPAAKTIPEMDDRVAIPVTLPQVNPTSSYWQDPPDADVADYLSADNVPDTADTVIIGSGITGTSVAHELLDSRRTAGRLVMLEARQACSGATGRNGLFSGRRLIF